MDEATQRRIASQGGKAAHLKGTAHEFNSEEARLAGRKGGQSRAANAALKARMMQNSQNSSASTTGSTAIEQSSQPETRQ